MLAYVTNTKDEPLVNHVLKWAVDRVEEADSAVETFEQAQQKARRDAKDAKGIDDQEERRLKTRMAQTDLRYARVLLKASNEFRRTAHEELGSIQNEFFVEKLDVGTPDGNGRVVVRAILREQIPAGYRLHWTVGEYKPTPDSGQGLAAYIDTRQVHESDATVQAILEKGDAYPVPEIS